MLPEDASVCPVCRSEELGPLDIRTFRYHVERCLFCSTVFEKEPDWRTDWFEDKRWKFSDKAKAVDSSFCPLCGRMDRVEEGGEGKKRNEDGPTRVQIVDVEQNTTDTLSVGEYLRLAELGRVMVLHTGDKEASEALFSAWFQVGHIEEGADEVLSVARLFDLLERGTKLQEVKRLLGPRRDGIGERWHRKFPVNWQEYSVSTGMA